MGEGQGVFSLSHMGCLLPDARDSDESVCLSLPVAPAFSAQGRRGRCRDFSPRSCLPRGKKTFHTSPGREAWGEGSQQLKALGHREAKHDVSMSRRVLSWGVRHEGGCLGEREGGKEHVTLFPTLCSVYGIKLYSLERSSFLSVG